MGVEGGHTGEGYMYERTDGLVRGWWEGQLGRWPNGFAMDGLRLGLFFIRFRFQSVRFDVGPRRFRAPNGSL